MNANVLPMRPMTVAPADAEKFICYFQALSCDPELAHAPAIVRTGAVKALIAGQRVGREALLGLTVDDRSRRALVVQLMAADDAIAVAKGWLW